MTAQDLTALYSGRILELAASAPRAGRLPAPQGSAYRRAPLCGSSVTVDVVMDGDRVADFAQDVRACALGQASSAVLGANVIGRSRDEIARAREALAAMLREDGPPPGPPFEDLEALLPARAFRNRHESILLAWDATLEAIDKAQQATASTQAG